MTRLRVLGAIVIGSALAVLLALVAFSPAAQANHSWGKYHWARTSNPFTLQLADNVSSTWDGYLATTSTDWSDSSASSSASVLDTRIIPGTRNPTTCTPTSRTVEVCNAAYGTNGWLGVAQIWVSRRHIVQGTTKVNDTYFSTGKYNTPSWRQLVMCQEVGHTFGLDHQDENFNNTNLGTCMDYTRTPDGPPRNVSPNAHDYEELDIIYSHFDSFTSVNASTGQPNAALNNPSEWGQLVKVAHGGKTQIFERDLPNRQRVVTFVIWA